MKRFCMTAAFAAAMFTFAHSHAGDWSGKVVEKDGVRHVVNPATPVEPDAVTATTEKWRVGGDDDVIFGSIDDVAVGPDGVSYLLDSQVSTVHVVSPSGEILRSIGREGEGPAEFRMASNVMLLADGNVCVVQVMPARAVMMTPEGQAAGDHPLPRGKDGSHAYLNGGTAVRGHLVVNLASLVQKETSFGLESTFARIDSDGNVVTTYWRLYQSADLANITFDEKSDAPPVWAAGPDGRFYANSNYDDYSIEVIGSDGTTAFVIDRNYTPLPKDARSLAHNDSLVAAGDAPAEMKFATTHRAVLDLAARPNGELWVLTGHSQRDVGDDAIARFDVFDSEGHFTRRVTLPGPCVFGRDDFRLTDDRAFVITNVGDFAGDFEPAGGTSDISVICLELGAGQ